MGISEFDGTDATNVPPAKRGLAMVFQSYALYPHMSVRKNIAFPMRMAKMSQEEQDKRIEAAAKALNLTDYLDRRPGQLSGRTKAAGCDWSCYCARTFCILV